MHFYATFFFFLNLSGIKGMLNRTDEHILQFTQSYDETKYITNLVLFFVKKFCNFICFYTGKNY